MSLYDDLDSKSRATDKVSGWSSGIKLLQSQLQLKKATVTQPKRDQQRRASLAPVIDLKSKPKDENKDCVFHPMLPVYNSKRNRRSEPSAALGRAPGHFAGQYDWHIRDEYDPMYPNDYEKMVRILRDKRDRESDKEERRRQERKRKTRFSDAEEQQQVQIPPLMAQLQTAPSGFAGLWKEDEENDRLEKPAGPKKVNRPTGGAAIAPPPSVLRDCVPEKLEPNAATGSQSYAPAGAVLGGGSIAAKIMAKYGFKEGQGLGKQEQGMSIALQVEKTSKRGGRIIHEKDIPLRPPTPPSAPSSPTEEQSITDIIKNPSKVVLLKNMVGPGEVDDDLEPEVKDECNTKYGEVTSIIIHEIPHDNPEEAVRIFLEFRRIESAIKAVVDLNGRFFGGRQVKATFYDPDKFDNLQLMD